MNRKIKLLALALAGLLVIVGFIRLQPKNDFPANKPGKVIDFVIADGELGSSIASKLEKGGVIKSAAKFVEEFTSDPKAQGISAGSHSIQLHIPTKFAIAQLLDPKRLNNLLIVKEGSTFSDVLTQLRGNDHISKNNSGYATVKSIFPRSTKSLEGSLFPAHYSFEPDTSVTGALETMINKAKSEVSRIGLAAGYDMYKPYEVLTIASMVQIEGDSKDFSKVARVIYNRLKIGMALQLNSTVQYAANLRGKITLSTKATKINSPYNTYIHVGLPPTPISNPSLDAIVASLKPASGDWLYFITVAPGDTRFTKNFTEFSNWNTEFNKNVAAGKFK
ncbi:MAG: endolytic transglycosylase MltG [Actinomycetales bacterium]|nr:MAG: endolytic transglycosylase MltG [Actinomycetales bacterium]